MSLLLLDPRDAVDEIVAFLQDTYQNQGFTNAVVAVSGGVDSGLALTLLCTAFSPGCVYPVFLPYLDQPINDAEEMARFNRIPEQNWTTINIGSIAGPIEEQLSIDATNKVRRGNVMARVRMILVYDLAKQKNGLVCGTENKSEKYLGYFTRYGDQASDVEPIQHLYKTQVRQLAQYLGVPPQIITKAPTAGLWAGQTDEMELGFTYDAADQVLVQLIDENKAATDIGVSGVEDTIVHRIIDRVKANEFKHQVPYVLKD